MLLVLTFITMQKLWEYDIHKKEKRRDTKRRNRYGR